VSPCRTSIATANRVQFRVAEPIVARVDCLQLKIEVRYQNGSAQCDAPGTIAVPAAKRHRKNSIEIQ